MSMYAKFDYEYGKSKMDLRSFKIGYLTCRGYCKEIIEKVLEMGTTVVGGCPTLVEENLEYNLKSVLEEEGMLYESPLL